MKDLTKKVSLFLFILLFAGSCSDDDNGNGGIDINQLPATARQFIAVHFEGEETYKVFKANTNEDEYTYKAVLSNKTSIYFSESGEWLKVDGNEKPLPQTLIRLHSQTETFLLENYPDPEVLVVEKMIYGYRYDIKREILHASIAFDHKGKYIGTDMNHDPWYAFLDGGISGYLSKHFDKAEKINLILSGIVMDRYYIAFVQKPYDCCITFDKFSDDYQALECYSYGETAIPKSVVTEIIPKQVLKTIESEYLNCSFLSITQENNNIDMFIRKYDSSTIPIFYDTWRNKIMKYPLEMKYFIETYFDRSVYPISELTFSYVNNFYTASINNYYISFDQDANNKFFASASRNTPLPQSYIDNEIPESIKTYIEVYSPDSIIWQAGRDGNKNYHIYIHTHSTPFIFDSEGKRIS